MAEPAIILIIDDSIDDRDAYRRMLERAPGARYRIEEAETGEEGIALIERLKPDCVLLDYSLPGRDGVSVLEDILTHVPEANVVMLTGQGSETVAVEVMKRGARDYLTKDSLTPQTLHRCVQNALVHGALAVKLEQKRQSLEIFTRAMAHDLKEPLRTIKSFSRILHGSQALQSDDRELLDYILSAADHMEDLIVKVSGFTRLEASSEAVLSPVSLDAVMDRVEDNLREQIGSRKARVLRGKLPQVMGDQTLLVQLMQNLVSNAIGYCDAPEPLIEVSARVEGRLCALTVSDNGPGIAPEHRELIFQPFKRLVGRGIEGTGLGLAICRRIVQLHGGSIRCVDKHGQGAAFLIELPQAESDVARQPQAANLPRSRGPESEEAGERLAEVLLVEDSPADVQLLKIKLMRREKISFNLHVAANGRDAMRMLRERQVAEGDPQIDLMLLDINMPIMDGFEVLEALSDDATLRDIPVLMLSTSSDESDMERARRLGAAGYMVKPPNLQNLQESLKNVDRLELLQRGNAILLCVEQTGQETADAL